MISIHLRGAKLYDPPPLRVQIYLGRFFKQSFLYGFGMLYAAKKIQPILDFLHNPYKKLRLKKCPK